MKRRRRYDRGLPDGDGILDTTPIRVATSSSARRHRQEGGEPDDDVGVRDTHLAVVTDGAAKDAKIATKWTYNGRTVKEDSQTFTDRWRKCHRVPHGQEDRLAKGRTRSGYSQRCIGGTEGSRGQIDRWMQLDLTTGIAVPGSRSGSFEYHLQKHNAAAHSLRRIFLAAPPKRHARRHWNYTSYRAAAGIQISKSSGAEDRTLTSAVRLQLSS
jgi:hypothetical protein